MPYEQKDLSGALFRNEKKSTDMQPDYTGDCTVSGTKWRIAAWIKPDRNGKKFMSLKFTVPQDRPAPKLTEPDNPHSIDPADVPKQDDIPF